MKKFLVLILASVFLTSCGSDSGNPSNAKSAPTSPSVPDVQEPLPEQMTVTYYSLSRTESPVSGWVNKTYTATGNCALVNNKTFCWSDGLKVLQWEYNNSFYGPLKYNYFRTSTNSPNTNPQTCNGGCQDDYFSTPKLMTQSFLNVVGSSEVQKIFSQGTPQTLNCTLENNDLNCGSVTFSGAQ